MAWYYALESWSGDFSGVNAGGKARADVNAILDFEQLRPLQVEPIFGRSSLSAVKKLSAHQIMRRRWVEAVGCLRDGDVLVMQFPLVGHTLLMPDVVHAIKRRGARLVLLIHDLDGLRMAYDARTRSEAFRIRREEGAALSAADLIIAHNERMIEVISERYGVDCGKMIPLRLFDYLVLNYEDPAEFRYDAKGNLAVAGNLSRFKAGYLYDAVPGLRLSLWGSGYEGAPPAGYELRGTVAAEELPMHLEGSFGLVWDGDSSATCSGTYGEYLRLNNPHKVSLYLAAGMPVAIWDQAALAPLVRELGAGVTAPSLMDLRDMVEGLGQAEYDAMREAAAGIGARLRSGSFTREALSEARRILA